jgi:hypothetical protein
MVTVIPVGDSDGDLSGRSHVAVFKPASVSFEPPAVTGAVTALRVTVTDIPAFKFAESRVAGNRD